MSTNYNFVFSVFASMLICRFKCDLTKSDGVSIKQCVMDETCTYNDNSILIAIDGTSSREILFKKSGEPRKFKSEIGVNKNGEWIWQSHVANFWDEYQGISYYFHGPDSSADVISAGNEIHSIVKKSKTKVCEFVEEYFTNIKDEKLNHELVYNMTLNGLFGIDIIGFSRGGFAAMELSRNLQINGCGINGEQIKPITVRWMGLYDPVQRDMDFGDILEIGDGYDNEEIAENVIKVAIAERSRFVHSRFYFGYAVDDTMYKDKRKKFNASHSGIGGQPGKGDCKEDPAITDVAAHLCSDHYSYTMDKMGAIETELFMRGDAIENGVPIPFFKPDANAYYGDFTDF